jgi:ribosomal protein S18
LISGIETLPPGVDVIVLRRTTIAEAAKIADRHITGSDFGRRRRCPGKIHRFKELRILSGHLLPACFIEPYRIHGDSMKVQVDLGSVLVPLNWYATSFTDK